MYVLVKSPAGRTTRLRVHPSDTVHAVKAKIQEQVTLVFNGVQLDDNLTLADYNIQHESTLDHQEKMKIFVTETVAVRTITIEVNRLDTVNDLRAKIQELEGFPKAQQCLVFANKRLDDGNRTMADHNIGNESTLLLVLLPCIPRGDMMQIFVKTLQGKSISLKVGSLDTVDSVKVKIYKMKHAPYPKQQRFVYAHRQLEGSSTLADCNVQWGSTIYLIYRLGCCDTWPAIVQGVLFCCSRTSSIGVP
ncbi:polyubiquitin 11-like [Aegilops tauschii subsp. strangulata]|uniref:polyubiquitin 11-like n=1 Tax=Aegilops tauschii subsp. strangulata TaxID=200361 RepID=UPI003CC85B5E